MSNRKRSAFRLSSVWLMAAGRRASKNDQFNTTPGPAVVSRVLPDVPLLLSVKVSVWPISIGSLLRRALVLPNTCSEGNQLRRVAIRVQARPSIA